MGTLFSHDGARHFKEHHSKAQAQQKQQKERSASPDAEPTSADETARELAVAARDASRVLQNLSSEVSQQSFLAQTASQAWLTQHECPCSFGPAISADCGLLFSAGKHAAGNNHGLLMRAR